LFYFVKLINEGDDYVTTVIEVLDHHIDRLEQRLNEIYSVESLEGYFRKDKKLNLQKEIEELEILESVYSVIDKEEIKVSKTSREYYDYLKAVREGLGLLRSELDRVSKEHSTEINNVQLLLRRFKDERKKY
jgi:hypothetical protein